MLRRFQFSLRALLGVAAVICLFLGGWHLLITYGEFIEVGPIELHRKTTIRGRLVRLLGPPELPYCIEINRESDSDLYVFSEADRSWLCIYEIRERTAFAHHPGRYRLRLIDYEPEGIPPRNPTAFFRAPVARAEVR